MVPEVERHKFMEHKGLSIDGDKGGDSMRRKMLPIAILAMLAFGCSAKASAQDIAIDETNFPDPGLREYVQTAYDTNKDGVLSDEENESAQSMNVYFNTDPNLVISLRVQSVYAECNSKFRLTDGYDATKEDLGEASIVKEFPCDQIKANPLSEYKTSTVAAFYVVGTYRWDMVINNGVKNWKGMELLTNLKRVSIGGSVPKKLVISDFNAMEWLTLGGDTSDFEQVVVKNCPKLVNFIFTRTKNLKTIDLSKNTASLKRIIQEEYCDSAQKGKTPTRINLKKLILKKAPVLESVFLKEAPIKKVQIKYTSLKKLKYIWLWSGDEKANLNLSSCKKLIHMTIHGKYNKLTLPNKELEAAYSTGFYGDDDYEELIPFGAKEGPKIIDISKSKNADDYADVIIGKWGQALKKGKTYTRTLIMNRKMYNSRQVSLESLQKRGIRIKIKG